MLHLLKAIIAIVVGAAFGLIMTWTAVMRTTLPGDVRDGPWHTSLDIGSNKGDAYLRARVALHGLFALNRTETLYYTAANDSGGTPLSGTCSYRIIGHDPDARWWSITAYGQDDFLIANSRHVYSISKPTVVHRRDGRFMAVVSPRKSEDEDGKDLPNWIPVTAEPFSLTLRLYNPSADVAASPARVWLPKIERWSCP